MACSTCSAATLSVASSSSRFSFSRAQCAPVSARLIAPRVAFRVPASSRSMSSNATGRPIYWKSSATGNCGGWSNDQSSSGVSQRMQADWVSRGMWFPVDVEETAQEYTFVGDVPGLGKNDIKVHCVCETSKLWQCSLHVHWVQYDSLALS